MIKVFSELTPWGLAYEVHFGNRKYESSANGLNLDIWFVKGGGFALPLTSLFCLVVVLIAKLTGRITEIEPRSWPPLPGYNA